MIQKQVSEKKQNVQHKPSRPSVKSKAYNRVPEHPSLQVQGIIGNHGVLRHFGSNIIQTKLIIGSPNDKYEQEADHVADEVMRMPEPNEQRQLLEKEEEEIQAKSLTGEITPLVQRQTEEVTPEISSGIQSLQGRGRPLSGSERSFFEPRFGADFSNVRVHNDTQASSVARSVKARAFTIGQNVVFGAGEYSPDTSSGRELLAHELMHVVQQNGEQTFFSTGNSTFCSDGHEFGQVFIQRRELAVIVHPYDPYIAIFVRTYRIDDWQPFLQAAYEWTRPYELNIFLAKAVGHDIFVQDDDPEHRREQGITLERVRAPSRRECIGLMYALLSTPGIDLIGMMSPRIASVLGYLLPRFIREYYQGAMEYAAAQSWGTGEDYERWRIQAARVAAFLGQAESAFGYTREVYRRRVALSPLPEYQETIEAHRRRISEIHGGEVLGLSPTGELHAQAMAGIQTSIALATAGAAVNPEQWGNITSHCNRRLEMHAQTLLGIIQRQRRIEEVSEAIANILVGAAFASMGAFTRRLSVGNAEVGTVARYDALESGLRETAKNGTIHMAHQASGVSSGQIRSRCATAFTQTLAWHVNRVRREMGIVPNEVVQAHTALGENFTRHGFRIGE